MRTEYKLSGGQHVPREVADVFYRRTVPFLLAGTHHSLEHLMQEAYFQGIKDAVAALSSAKGDRQCQMISRS